MDLFDLGTYFASHVPIRALKNPLLKYAACAYAAKQLGRVRGVKAVMGGAASSQARMEVWPGSESIDWYHYGAKYYDKAIQLLVDALKKDGKRVPSPTIEAFGEAEMTAVAEDGQRGPRKRRKISNDQFTNLHSDETLAATAILSVYEFLSATGSAWNQHLDGAKSLLDIAQAGMVPLEHPQSGLSPYQSPTRSKPSKARRAAFWNLARQDFLAACKSLPGLLLSMGMS